MYATNISGTWITTTVDSDLLDTGVGSIALDASDHAHISYTDFTNNTIKYATNASGSWVTTTVDSSEVISGATSLALDTAGSV